MSDDRRGEKNAAGAARHSGTEPHKVAEAIFRAATDGSSRVGYPVGSDTRLVAVLRRLLPERPFYRASQRAVLD